jgi:anthranilate 1,2-dioxygenase small subunit
MAPIERVAALQYAYARALDEGRLEDWPGFFARHCLYRVHPRENLELGLPLNLIYCPSQGMLQDRVRSLREANIYNIHFPRRQVTNVEIIGGADGVLEVRAVVTVFQTDQEGRTILYAVGQYRDRVVEAEGRLLFAEKHVVLDSFNVPNLLAIPL